MARTVLTPAIDSFLPDTALDMSRAACASGLFDPEMWFPDPKDEVTRSRAEAVCAVCPIRDACLDFGVDNRMTGVWGGVSLVRGKVEDTG